MIYRTLCSICNSLISIITWSNDEGDAAAACDEESTTMSRQHFFPVTMTLVGGGFKGDFQELFENNNIKLGLFCLGDGFGHHWVVVNNLWQVCERGIYKHVHRGKIPWKWRNAHHVFFSFSKWGLDCCWLTPHLWEYDGQTYSLHQAVRLGKPTHRMQFLLHFKRFFIHYFDKCVHIFQSFAFIFGGLKCTETFFCDLCPTCITLTQSEFQKWLDGVYETQFRF